MLGTCTNVNCHSSSVDWNFWILFSSFLPRYWSRMVQSTPAYYCVRTCCTLRTLIGGCCVWKMLINICINSHWVCFVTLCSLIAYKCTAIHSLEPLNWLLYLCCVKSFLDYENYLAYDVSNVVLKSYYSVVNCCSITYIMLAVSRAQIVGFFCIAISCESSWQYHDIVAGGQARRWWSGFTAALLIGDDIIVAGHVAHIVCVHMPMHINQHNVFIFIHLMFAHKSTHIILSTSYTCNWSLSESRCRSTTTLLCYIVVLWSPQRYRRSRSYNSGRSC